MANPEAKPASRLRLILVRIRAPRPSLCPVAPRRAGLRLEQMRRRVQIWGPRKSFGMRYGPHTASSRISPQGLCGSYYVPRTGVPACPHGPAGGGNARDATSGPTRRYTSALFVLHSIPLPITHRGQDKGSFVRAAAGPFRTALSVPAYGLRHGVTRPAPLGTSPSP